MSTAYGPKSRSQAAADAVQRELSRRAGLIDQDDDLVSVTVTLKFTAGTAEVRGVVYQEERLSSRPGRGR